MTVLDKLIDQVRRLVPFDHFSSEFIQTHKPLLNDAEIFDLLYRVQGLNVSPEHFRDVAHSMFGDARSVYRGYGMDYEESRPYQPGDELRFMNWRLTARTGEPYMKVFREERRPGVFIAVDRRAAMRFGSRVRLKVTQAVRIATVAAFGAQLQNIPVGGVLLETDHRWIAEQPGEQGAINLIREASEACPPLTSKANEPSLGHILKLLLAILTKGSRLYIISDFMDISDTDRPTLLQLGTDHQVYAIHITDPAEQDLAPLGKLRFTIQDKTTGISIDTSNATTRNTYKQSAGQHLNARESLFTSLAIPYIRIATDCADIEKRVPFV